MTLPDPDRDSGMSTLVLGNLPPHQLRVMRFILQRGGEIVYTTLTEGLAALPENNRDHARLKAIPGVVPGAHDRPTGCSLSPRCRYAVARCHRQEPALTGPPGRGARCHFRLDALGNPSGNWQAERAAEAAVST